MKRIIKLFLMIAVSVICLFSVACKDNSDSSSSLPPTIQTETPILLLVGENFTFSVSAANGEEVSAQADTSNVELSVLGKNICVTALSRGITRVSVTIGKRTECWDFEVQDTLISETMVGLYIMHNPVVKTVLGITTPIQLKPIVKYDNAPVETSVSYSIKDETICSLSETGLLTPLKEGMTEFTMTANYQGQSTEKTCNLIVYPNADIVFEWTKYNLFLQGETEKTISYDLYLGDNATPETNLSAVQFTSSNPTVCEVTSDGKIVAKSFGQAEVTANYNGFEASVSVNVYNAEISIVTAEDLFNVQEGNYYRFESDISYAFENTDNLTTFQDAYIIEELNATIDGNGHTLTLSATTGDFTNEHGGHSHNVNFIRTIGKAGVVRNISIVYSLTARSNESYGTFAFGTNDGLVEDVVYTVQYGAWFVYDATYVSYLASGGTGTFRNIVAYITNSGWQHNDEVSANRFHLVDGIVKLENVLVITGSVMKMPSGGTNVIKVETAEEATVNGFTMLDFNFGGKESAWELGAGGVPIFKLGIVNIYEQSDLTENKYTNAHFELMNDLTVELDQSEGSNWLIDTLNGTFDGNGYTLTINIVGNTKTPINDGDMNLVHTVTSNGIIRNLRVIYNYRTDADVNCGSLLTRINNGLIEDVEMYVTFDLWYINIAFGYVSLGGTGTVRNVVFNLTTKNGWQFGVTSGDGAGKFSFCGNNTAENVLIVYGGNTNIGVPKGINVIAIQNTSDYTTAHFDTSGFDAQVWTLKDGRIPTIKVAEKPYSEVETVEELVIEAAKGDRNIRLMSDITFNVNMSNNSADYKIATLSTMLDGNGYTIKVNVTGGQMYADMSFIGEIATTGVLKNVNIIYDIKQNGDISILTGGLVGINNGTISNVNINIIHATTYVSEDPNASFTYIAYQGNGIFENSVVKIDGSGWQFGQRMYKIIPNTVLCENILLVYSGTNDVSGTNCVKISATNDYETSGFNTNSFDFTIWNIEDGVIPSLKKKE